MANAQPHPAFTEPTNRYIKLWRYFDLAKFVAMLQHSGLYFPRARLLGDSFEGSRPVPNQQFENYVRGFRHLDPSLAVWRDLTEQQLTDSFDNQAELRRAVREELLVSCWHMNEHESAAMWKLYSQSNEAVCIQTTFQRLKDLMPEWVDLGQVKYIDYEYQAIPENNLMHAIMHKRRSFDHEREVRGVILAMNPTFKDSEAGKQLDKSGTWVGVNLSGLLDAIFVSPHAPPWFADAVRKLVEKYDITAAVHQSSLIRDPIY